MKSKTSAESEEMDLVQSDTGYRFSVDAFLLAAFASRFRPLHFLDMGAGCGVISWQLKRLLPETTGVAVELQEDFVSFAQENLKGTGIVLHHGDVRFFHYDGPAFDLLISNPPFFRVGHGKLSKNPVKAIARHTLHGTVVDWVEHVQKYLAEEGGICLIYPFRYLSELVSGMRQKGFYLNEFIDVFSYFGQEAKLCCLYFSRRVVQTRRESLVLYKEHRKRTPEAIKFLRGTQQEINFL